MTLRFRHPLLLAAFLLGPLAGCPGNPGTTVTPLAQPTSAPVATNSATPSPVVSSPTPTAVPSDPLAFRDDFDGLVLNQDRWASFAQSGIIRFEAGKLDLLNTANQKNFPYVVSKQSIVPPTGPFFVELSYLLVSGGAPVSFSLDYLPADVPNEKPLTTPFMSTTWFYSHMKINFETEAGAPSFTGLKGYTFGTPHRLRLENDGSGNYRVIFDQTEVGTFHSKRRPTRFWVGTNPPADLKTGTNWPRLQIDYIAAGVLLIPDPATPEGTASQAASPAP